MTLPLHGCIICNPSSGTAEQFGSLRRILKRFKRLDSRDADHAAELAAAEAREDTVIVAAGGDGTINRVVSGMMSVPRRKAILGILPLGTGNDLARTLGIPLDDPLAAMELILARSHTRWLDLIRVRMGSQRRWCVNAAAGGFTGQVNEVMTDDLKKTWGPLAYLRGAIKVVPDLTNYHTTIEVDGARPQRADALNIVVANGQSAGGGLKIAPMADPSDGLLDLALVKSATLLQLSGVATRLLTGNYHKSKHVSYRRARQVTIRSRPGMWFNVDGDLIGNQTVSFEIVPRAIQVIAPVPAEG